MTKNEFCKKHNLTEDQFSGKEKIGYLYLSGLTSIPDGFNPTVGGYLYLSGLTSIPDGFNPTVGGYLDLRGDIKYPKGFKKSDYERRPVKPISILKWQGGKYIKVDGIFTEVVHKRGNVFKIKQVNKTKEYYLVTNGEKYAHGDTVKKAKEDLEFKIVAEKLKNDPIKPNTLISIQYYRIVTGACQAGVESWMKQNGITKDKIKAKDLLPILKKTNAYGADRFEKLYQP